MISVTSILLRRVCGKTCTCEAHAATASFIQLKLQVLWTFLPLMSLRRPHWNSLRDTVTSLFTTALLLFSQYVTFVLSILRCRLRLNNNCCQHWLWKSCICLCVIAVIKRLFDHSLLRAGVQPTLDFTTGDKVRYFKQIWNTNLNKTRCILIVTAIRVASLISNV